MTDSFELSFITKQVRTEASAPRVTIYPLKEALMDDGVPGYNTALLSVALEGPDASLFSHRSYRVTSLIKNTPPP